MSLALAGFPAHALDRSDKLRWSASLAITLGLHGMLAFFLLDWHVTAPPLPPAQSVTMIDLPPLPAPPQPVATHEPTPPPPMPQPQPELVKPEPKPVAKPKPVERHIAPHPVPLPIPAPAPSPVEPAPAAAPPALAPPPTAAPQVEVSASFRDALAAYLARYKRYPHAAQTKGEEGTVLVRFVLDRSGEVSDTRIVQSSGHALLDTEVLSLLRRAAPLPAMPSSMAASRIEIVVPVAFQLR